MMKVINYLCKGQEHSFLYKECLLAFLLFPLFTFSQIYIKQGAEIYSDNVIINSSPSDSITSHTNKEIEGKIYITENAIVFGLKNMNGVSVILNKQESSDFENKPKKVIAKNKNINSNPKQKNKEIKLIVSHQSCFLQSSHIARGLIEEIRDNKQRQFFSIEIAHYLSQNNNKSLSKICTKTELLYLEHFSYLFQSRAPPITI